MSCDIVAKRFPKDYWKARAAFRESATNASAALSALEMGADVGLGNLTTDVGQSISPQHLTPRPAS